MTQPVVDLLTTYADFYNGAGMDDHPLQHWIDHHLKKTDVANAAATSHAICTARLVQNMAQQVDDAELVSRM